MRRWFLFLTVLCLFVAGSASALTVDELIAKHIQARGGMEKIRAIHSVRQTGKIELSGGRFSANMAYTWIGKRPEMMRVERTFQGLTAILAYDGSIAWRISPFRGRVDPEKMSADDAKTAKLEADFEGPLVDYKTKGNTVEYLGTEDVDGTDAHKLKVTFKTGDVRYIYLDPDYFLEIREVDQIRVRGVQEEQETDLGNYEQVDGVYFPFSIESGSKDQPRDTKITIEKVEANPDVDDQLFHFPGSGK